MLLAGIFKFVVLMESKHDSCRPSKKMNGWGTRAEEQEEEEDTSESRGACGQVQGVMPCFAGNNLSPNIAREGRLVLVNPWKVRRYYGTLEVLIALGG
jgi:hypothetical protein